MKILLLGANGQVGHELLAALRSSRIIAATRSGLLDNGTACEAADLADQSALRELLERIHPEVIINAAAYTAVDRAEQEAELADRVNHQALATLGNWAQANRALVVHYSTDYVFDGSALLPYHEDDPTAPLGVYGHSKLAGEVALRASGAKHFIFRTAWVYAARGSNFLHTMLRIGTQNEHLHIVDDQIGTPTPAGLIARHTVAALLRWVRLDEHERDQALGTYHLTSSVPCSWFEFATAIFDEAHAAGIISRKPKLTPISTSQYPTPARRPAWSVLDNGKLALVFGLAAPPWRRGLHDVIDQLQKQKQKKSC